MTEVAVIVPTHNRPNLLVSTLRSVLAQRGVDFSVTVVDDGSTDACAVAGVIEAMRDSRVHLVRHDTPRGVSAARNTGIANTVSEWVAFCDDDDLWCPAKLDAQLTMARRTSAPWAYTGVVAVDGELRILHGAPPLPPEQLVDALEHYNPVPAGSSNVIVRRNTLDTVGWFDASLLSAADWDLWIRLGRHAVPAGVLRPLVAYRQHGTMMRQNRRRVLADLEVIATKYGSAVDRARHFRWAAWDSMAERSRGEALTYYAYAVRHGDIASIGRAAVALLYPGIVGRRLARPIDEWAGQAQSWLNAARGEAAADRVSAVAATRNG